MGKERMEQHVSKAPVGPNETAGLGQTLRQKVWRRFIVKKKKKKTNDYWSSILIPGILNYPTDGYGTGTKTEIQINGTK